MTSSLVGSEMCIRDSVTSDPARLLELQSDEREVCRRNLRSGRARHLAVLPGPPPGPPRACSAAVAADVPLLPSSLL
eukprot:4492189-Prorocentrum_lima.AAC.1